MDGETVETVSDFILGGSKITSDRDCSHEIKTCLFLGRKVMTNLDSILKSRDITLSTKVHLVKAMIFPVVMYEESWALKNWCLNCGVGEDSWESLGQQGDPTSPFWRRSALGFLWKESYGQHRQHIKKQRHYFANKCPSSQGYGFPSSHIWMWELDRK